MELKRLKQIAQADSWNLRAELEKYIEELEKEQKGKPVRTDSQHNSLFLWLGQIEQVAEEQGVTWDRLIKHTHQLKVTKDNLHDAWKQLQKALYGTKSTKQLKKTGQIDTIIDHFVDLFAKEGMELPPFPNDEEKSWESIGYKRGGFEYPENNLGEPKF